MIDRSVQLTLGFKIRDDATFGNFYPGNNSLVLETLNKLILALGERFVFLSGAEGFGKSHLLQACCHEIVKRGGSAIYIPLQQYQELSTSLFEELETIDLVCLDDVDSVLNAHPESAKWEEAIFHLYNRCLNSQNRLLISARVLPQQLGIQLADLHSRLMAGLVLTMKGLNEQQMILALQMRAYARGLLFSREVGEYLLRRCPREMKQLISVLEKLDQSSLTLQRRLTIPFVKQVLTP